VRCDRCRSRARALGVLGQPGEELDRRVDHLGREHLSRCLVVAVRHATREGVLGHPTGRLVTPPSEASGFLSFRALKGVRYFFRNFTALAVREHLRSQIDRTDAGAELTPNEAELVRFTSDRADQLTKLADESSGR